MHSTAFDTELELWEVDGVARIEYSRAVMEQLRIDAVDGFHRLAHGGVEIGGVLFGVREGSAVKVLAHRALECEHEFGPSFTLSENDRRALEGLLALPASAELSGMEPVGWYHSHTRKEILLTETDLELYQKYFPKPWQIALVLRPNRFDPVRAGFFFREPDGTIQAEASRNEFALTHSRRSNTHAAPDLVPMHAVALPMSTPISLGAAIELTLADRVSSPPAKFVGEKSIEPLPLPPRTRRALGTWILLAAAIVIITSGVLYLIFGSSKPAVLSLRAVDVGGQLRVDWDRNSSIIAQSQSGILEIEDGPAKVNVDLSPEHLRAGNITYLRNSGSVLVRLWVRGADGKVGMEMTRFLGAPVNVAAAPVPEPVSTGSADRSADDGAEAAPSPRERAPRDESSAGSSRTFPKEERGPIQSAAATPAAPTRRPWPPPSIMQRQAEPSFPAPPVVAANGIFTTPNLLPRLPAAVPPKPSDHFPAEGKIIWTGKLPRSGTVQILGDRASVGQITGALPGTAVRVHIFPGEMTPDGVRLFTADPRLVRSREAPGAQNGWNRTEYVLNRRKSDDVVVVEAPTAQNAWSRLTLRAERGDHSIVVLQWERVPSDPALHTSGAQ
jgi:proteasome lid subunit RPN8/RPN11